MNKILLTGLSKKEFAKKVKNMEPLGCFFCQQTEKGESVVITKDGIRFSKLPVRRVTTEFAGSTLEIPVCVEHLIAFKGISELLTSGEGNKE